MIASTSLRPIVRLGTRASPLAMAQAHMVKAALIAAHGLSEDAVLICPQVAEGDKVLDRPLADIGGKALWTKGLDRMLLAGEIDFAVHSMKDVETIRPFEIAIAAMLERADVRDRLIGADSVSALKPGARVGTSSPRRAAQLRRLRPDLEIVMFRGNVATRLAKLESGEADATLLAAAGLDRLGHPEIGHAVPVTEMLPAASQGAVGIECRSDDAETRALLAAIDHAPTRAAVEAERAFLAALTADCHSPVGAHARYEGGTLKLSGQILSGDGELSLAGDAIVDGPDSAAALARRLLKDAPPALRALFAA
jgi:hydroxymethylbilane synthase